MRPSKRTRIILIPGLGYDHRIFDKLDLADRDTTYLRWIEPRPRESIHQYALRLFEGIGQTGDELILIGHSLGGIVAQEIASARKVAKIILVSSLRSREEMPGNLRVIRTLRMDRLISKNLLMKTVRFWGKKHGLTSAGDLELFRDMIGAQTNNYLRWALRQLSLWHEPPVPESTQIVRIHGTNDITFPIEMIADPGHIIANGSHIAVYKQGQKVSEIVRSFLDQEQV